MLVLLFLTPHSFATSSGSMRRNSPPCPRGFSQQMIFECFSGFARSSRRNCHNWIWPDVAAAADWEPDGDEEAMDADDGGKKSV